jgi:hypothetical protein
MSHIQERLESRGIKNITERDCFGLASMYNQDTALILGKEKFLGDENFIILIVRHFRAITIMFRRCSQNINEKQLGVEKIEYIQ